MFKFFQLLILALMIEGCNVQDEFWLNPYDRISKNDGVIVFVEKSKVRETGFFISGERGSETVDKDLHGFRFSIEDNGRIAINKAYYGKCEELENCDIFPRIYVINDDEGIEIIKRKILSSALPTLSLFSSYRGIQLPRDGFICNYNNNNFVNSQIFQNNKLIGLNIIKFDADKNNEIIYISDKNSEIINGSKCINTDQFFKKSGDFGNNIHIEINDVESIGDKFRIIYSFYVSPGTESTGSFLYDERSQYHKRLRFDRDTESISNRNPINQNINFSGNIKYVIRNVQFRLRGSGISFEIEVYELSNDKVSKMNVLVKDFK